MSTNEPDGVNEDTNPEDEDSDSGDASGITARIAVGWAKEMGYEKAANVIANWPELVCKGIAVPCKRIRDLILAGEPVPPELGREFEKALEDNPKEAVVLLGPLVAANFDDSITAKSERDFFLSESLMCLSLGNAALLNFTNNQPDMSQGMTFNLENNVYDSKLSSLFLVFDHIEQFF